MKWYQGPIQSAITEAKMLRKIFLVFVEGDDDASKVMANTYEESTVIQSLQNDCVAIKLSTNSDQFRMFSQIYPVIIVPSSFFIGIDGVPLEVVGGKVNVEEFQTKIENVLKLHKSKVDKISPEHTDAVATRSSEPESPPLDDKVERAKQLIEERKLQKQKEQQEDEKRKEIEKRRVGRELQKFKEEQEKKEMLKWAEERQKEKLEDKLARERIKAQIAQDRAERNARLQNNPTPAEKNDVSPSSLAERSPPPQSSANQCRIQFRLPDASTRSHEFEPSDTMNSVFGFVQRVIGFSNVTLATTFPRRQFTKKENGKSTLRELELVPSAVLIIIPNSGMPGSSLSTGRGGGGVLSIVYSLLTPLFFIWNFLTLSFFGSNSATPSSSSGTPPASTQDSRQPDAPNRPGSSPPTLSTARPGATDSRPASSSSGNNSPSQRYRRDGNIHRLANDSPDDDDENNTWNGNSTQQL